METDKNLYNQILDCCIAKNQEIALNTIVVFLTNLRGQKKKIKWLEDCLHKIKNGEKK